MSRRQGNVHTGGFCERFSSCWNSAWRPGFCSLHLGAQTGERAVCGGTAEEHAFVCGRGGELAWVCCVCGEGWARAYLQVQRHATLTFLHLWLHFCVLTSDCANIGLCACPHMHACVCVCVWAVGSAPAVWAMWRRMYQGVTSWQLAGKGGSPAVCLEVQTSGAASTHCRVLCVLEGSLGKKQSRNTFAPSEHPSRVNEISALAH